MKSLMALLQSFFLRIWRASATKYVLVLAFAAVWMLLFDRYNLISRNQLSAQIYELKQDETHYRQAIEELDREARRLENDPAALEKYAREQYHMRKPGEDVFVITEE